MGQGKGQGRRGQEESAGKGEKRGINRENIKDEERWKAWKKEGKGSTGKDGTGQ